MLKDLIKQKSLILEWESEVEWFQEMSELAGSNTKAKNQSESNLTRSRKGLVESTNPLRLVQFRLFSLASKTNLKMKSPIFPAIQRRSNYATPLTVSINSMNDILLKLLRDV